MGTLTKKGFQQFYAEEKQENILREIGAEKVKREYEQVRSAIDDPKEYIRKKMEMAEAIEEEVKYIYRTTFSNYIEAGHPAKEAKAKALETSKHMYNVRTAELHMLYPDKYVNNLLANEILVKKTNMQT